MHNIVTLVQIPIPLILSRISLVFLIYAMFVVINMQLITRQTL
jgi:hypothetical protein